MLMNAIMYCWLDAIVDLYEGIAIDVIILRTIDDCLKGLHGQCRTIEVHVEYLPTQVTEKREYQLGFPHR